jgi:signal transduction histidine kinase
MSGQDPLRTPAHPVVREPVSFVKATPKPQIDQAGTGVGALMLARYLVGRALAARVSAMLWIAGAVLLAGAVALWIGRFHLLAVLVALLGLIVLGFRALVMLVLRKVMAVGRLGAAEQRITALVRDTGGDLRRELRRIGLPGSVFGMPLLVMRILGRRRAQTFDRMRRFDVTNVVPRSRRAELEFLVREELLHRGARRR